MRRFILIVAVSLAALLLGGCLYVPGGPGVHGGIDYVITPGGTFFFPDIEIDVEPRGRVVVPAPGGYYRRR
jgi:hypothetical protein